MRWTDCWQPHSPLAEGWGWGIEQQDTPQVGGGRDNTKTSPECACNHQRNPSSGCNQSQLVLIEGEEWLHGDNNRHLLHQHQTKAGDDTETIIEVTIGRSCWD